ncbi:hypothetical protein [Bdellovibrio sp. NC01]|uniref:hypothetical protein n=1 Tax=Bdellovibrio sp. NC01 TaxID=2220073 RepID=UPI00115953B7|nr:hypothetical protein [Bdellovibrio sp. NC01]QDK38755.1 hypothetical protein DOE51_14750 [Bdellovibrio sp. NC01]
MTRSILSAILILSSSCFAKAEVQVFKILDGSSLSCPSTNSTDSQPEKAIGVSLVKEAATDKTMKVTVNISAVTCQNGIWIADVMPASREYVAPNGKNVRVSYDNYELLLVNERYEIIQQRRLGDLSVEQKGTQTFSLPYNRGATQNYDLFIRVHKTVSTDNYQYSETMHFGGFRLRMN